MSPAQRTDAALRGLVAAVEKELDILHGIASRLARAPGRLDEALDDGPARAYLAVELHKYYTAFESLIERVFKVLDGVVPQGDRSHQEMLEQAGRPVEGIRPTLLDPDTLGDLSHLLSFRHFFRHAYAVELDWDKLEDHRSRVARRHAAITSGVEACLTHVRAALSVLPLA